MYLLIFIDHSFICLVNYSSIYCLYLNICFTFQEHHLDVPIKSLQVLNPMNMAPGYMAGTAGVMVEMCFRGL